jgi:hypothetical protein
MHVGSTEFFEALSQRGGRYLLLKHAIPRGRLKRDVIWLKEADGCDLVMGTASGFVCSPVELPIPIFEDLLRSGLIKQDGPEDYENGTVFRPTPIEQRPVIAMGADE